jgi:hypothetical protein
MNMNAPIVEGEGERQAETEAAPTTRLTPAPEAQKPQSVGEGLSAAPRRRPMETMPKLPESFDRPVDAESAKEVTQPNATEKTVPEPFRTSGLPRSPVAPQIAETLRPREPEKEVQPELPLTPVQRGLKDSIVTTPPSGIHNTPSKKLKQGNHQSDEKYQNILPGILFRSTHMLRQERFEIGF